MHCRQVPSAFWNDKPLPRQHSRAVFTPVTTFPPQFKASWHDWNCTVRRHKVRLTGHISSDNTTGANLSPTQVSTSLKCTSGQKTQAGRQHQQNAWIWGYCSIYIKIKVGIAYLRIIGTGVPKNWGCQKTGGAKKLGVPKNWGCQKLGVPKIGDAKSFVTPVWHFSNEFCCSWKYSTMTDMAHRQRCLWLI